MVDRHFLSEFASSTSEISAGPARKRSRTSSSSSSVSPLGTGPSYSGSAQRDSAPGIPAASMTSVVQLPLATWRKRVSWYNSRALMPPLEPRTADDDQSWTWLLDLTSRLNVGIEVIDEECLLMLPVGPGPTAAALRNQLTTEGSPLRSTIAMVTPEHPESVAID